MIFRCASSTKAGNEIEFVFTYKACFARLYTRDKWLDDQEMSVQDRFDG